MHDDIENIMIKECQEEICFSIIFKNENLHNCTQFPFHSLPFREWNLLDIQYWYAVQKAKKKKKQIRNI